MTTINDIARYFAACTTATVYGCVNGTGLSAIYRHIFNTNKNLPKADMVKGLALFYSNPQNIENIWASLSACERDFMTYVVQYNGKEFYSTTIELAQKHNIALEYHDRWGSTKNLMDDFEYSHNRVLHLLKRHFPKTNTVLFFPNGTTIPFFVLERLKKLIQPMKFDYPVYTPSEKMVVICREDRISDFAAMIRFAASEKIKVKPGTYDITKAKLAKMTQSIGFEEICDNDGTFGIAKETIRSSDFKVGLPLFLLAANAGLLNVEGDGTVVPSKQSGQILSLSPSRFVKKLFDDYMSRNKIYELQYVPYLQLYDGYGSVPWHECRKQIIDVLKNVPVNQWVSYKDFDKYTRIFCGDFFRKFLNCALSLKGFHLSHYGYHRYEFDWDECEAQIIRLMLSFLCALGMIDVAYTENTPRIRFGNKDFCVGIGGFRITNLGAWVLGLTNSYTETKNLPHENDAGSFIVLPDYTVIISGLKSRIEHETYLSPFLTKTSDDVHVTTYKLDFASALRAFGLGIEPKTLKAYLKNACGTPLPDNVVRTLDDWQAKAHRVHIKTVTIIETDDPLLLAEIKHLRAMEKIVEKDVQHAVVIDGKQQKKAKTAIEKNGWFVGLD